MKKAFLLGCLAAILAMGTTGWADEPIMIPAVAAAPALDGKFDDACWRDAAKVERFYLQKSDQPLADTTVRLARDEQWLYIGAECKNPRMSQVRQRVFMRDGPVFTDDSLTVFVRPDQDTKQCNEFALSFANVQYDKRFNATGMREDVWSAPWRSATQVQEDGWTAEMAIPLFALECDDLGRMQINVARVFMEVKLDEMNAFESDQRIFHAIRLGWEGGATAPENFMAVGGMGGFKPTIPFAPRITGAAATGYVGEGDKLFYGVKATLESGSPMAGEAELIVVEERGEKFVTAYTECVALEGGATKNLAINVPVDNFSERRVTLKLVESGHHANVLAACQLDAKSFEVINKAFAGRSYVTTEPMPVRLEFGLSLELLKELRVAVEVNGKLALETKTLQPMLTLEIPLDKLNEGENAVRVRLLSGQNEIAMREMTARRLAPRPGFEVKLDYIKGVMLKNGQPYFPVALFAHSLYPQPAQEGIDEPAERIFKFLGRDIGINTLVRTAGADHLDRFMELAGKYGMDVINWNYPRPDDIRSRFEENDPSFAIGADAMSLEARCKVWRTWYDKLEPKAVEETKYLRECRNLIGYYNQDEPNLPPRDYRIAVAEWYWKTVTALDPYRPLMLLFAREIPHGDNWTRWGEILGYDVYPNPHAGGHIYNDPGLGTAYYACELRERCRRDNKVMWFVPLANLINPAKQAIGMNKTQMFCQAYSAIIYGVRGFLYFGLSNVLGTDAWDALREISAQIKEMSPALLNGDIAQDIRYPEGTFMPIERKFPMVNVAVFQYPDGDYLLLAVNVRVHSVQTEFKVAGLKQADRLFVDGIKPNLQGETFTDKLEPYGVRAYRLKIGKTPEERVTVDVAMTAVPEELYPLANVPAIAAQLMFGKNHVANPCFRQQANPGVPDFYKPDRGGIDDGQKGSAWFVDDTMLWEGIPSLRFARRMFGSFYPPLTTKPIKMTFSFYARAAEKDARVSISVLDVKKASKSFVATSEWTRYQITFDLPPGDGKRMGVRLFIMNAKGGAVWINGLQLEEGETATEFQDDSVLVKKK